MGDIYSLINKWEREYRDIQISERQNKTSAEPIDVAKDEYRFIQDRLYWAKLGGFLCDKLHMGSDVLVLLDGSVKTIALKPVLMKYEWQGVNSCFVKAKATKRSFYRIKDKKSEAVSDKNNKESSETINQNANNEYVLS